MRREAWTDAAYHGDYWRLSESLQLWTLPVDITSHFMAFFFPGMRKLNIGSSNIFVCLRCERLLQQPRRHNHRSLVQGAPLCHFDLPSRYALRSSSSLATTFPDLVTKCYFNEFLETDHRQVHPPTWVYRILVIFFTLLKQCCPNYLQFLHQTSSPRSFLPL